MTRIAALPVALTIFAACNDDGKAAAPLLPDPPGSQILVQGRNPRFGVIDIGVKLVADGKAGLPIVPKQAERQTAPVDVVLGLNESTDIAETRVTVIAVDDKSEPRRVRVTIEQLASTRDQSLTEASS